MRIINIKYGPIGQRLSQSVSPRGVQALFSKIADARLYFATKIDFHPLLCNLVSSLVNNLFFVFPTDSSKFITLCRPAKRVSRYLIVSANFQGERRSLFLQQTPWRLCSPSNPMGTSARWLTPVRQRPTSTTSWTA
jgi:hypothetical protein